LLLRASGEVQSNGVDINVVANVNAADSSGIEHAGILIAFADAVVNGSDSEVTQTRETLVSAMGYEAMVDAAGVIGNFQRMNRIADSAGLELDAPVRAMSSDFRDDLGISKFSTAANTKKTGPAMKLFSRLIFPLALKFYKIGRAHV